MSRKLLFSGALIALLIVTRAPGPREPKTLPLPCEAAWRRAEEVLAGPAPPPAEVYAGVVRELEVVCGDPGGAIFLERTLRQWPAFEPTRRARAAEAFRHGYASPDTWPIRTQR